MALEKDLISAGFMILTSKEVVETYFIECG